MIYLCFIWTSIISILRRKFLYHNHRWIDYRKKVISKHQILISIKKLKYLKRKNLMKKLSLNWYKWRIYWILKIIITFFSLLLYLSRLYLQVSDYKSIKKHLNEIHELLCSYIHHLIDSIDAINDKSMIIQFLIIISIKETSEWNWMINIISRINKLCIYFRVIIIQECSKSFYSFLF